MRAINPGEAAAIIYETCKKAARANWEQHGHVAPVAVDLMGVRPLHMPDRQTSTVVMQRILETSPLGLVCFVIEGWGATLKPDEQKQIMEEDPNCDNIIPPSERDDRYTVVIVQLYESGKPSTTAQAVVDASGKLGEWTETDHRNEFVLLKGSVFPAHA